MSDTVRISNDIQDILSDQRLSMEQKLEKVFGLQFKVGQQELIYALAMSLAITDGHLKTVMRLSSDREARSHA